MSKKLNFGPETIAIHAGEWPDAITKASAPNIVMSTTFVTEADAGFSVENMEEDSSFIYTRWGNPTTYQLEEKLSALEGAENAIVFASGMGAITALLFGSLKSGDHAVVSDVGYAAMSEITNDMIPQLGILITKVDSSDLVAVRQAMRPNTKLVYIESPCNPLIRLTDIAAVAEITHQFGAKLAIDSTFATPAATKPLELGADYVIHSLTKYLNGHGDALGGAILGSSEVISPLRKTTSIRFGASLSPFNAWLIMRGLATFHLRMKAHEEKAFAVARFLENHQKVKRVIYPGLESHPQHELAKKQMKNFSGMLTFQVENGKKVATVFAKELKIIHYAVSLGHQRSLLFYLNTKELQESSFHLNTEAQKESWKEFAGDGIFRLSVGLEDSEDLNRDLSEALDLL